MHSRAAAGVPGRLQGLGSETERDISSPNDRNTACPRCSAVASQWKADLEPSPIAASSSLDLEQQPVVGAGSCEVPAAFKQCHQLTPKPGFYKALKAISAPECASGVPRYFLPSLESLSYFLHCFSAQKYV